jgi:hypothetical protein
MINLFFDNSSTFQGVSDSIVGLAEKVKKD